MKNDSKWTKLGLLVGPDPKVEGLGFARAPRDALLEMING